MHVFAPHVHMAGDDTHALEASSTRVVVPFPAEKLPARTLVNAPPPQRLRPADLVEKRRTLAA